MEKINLAQSYQRIYQSTVQGRPLYLSDFETILESVAGFLIIAGGTIGKIFIGGIFGLFIGKKNLSLIN